MKRGWTLLVAGALALGACSGGEGDRHAVSGEGTGQRDGPTRPPGAHVEGNYILIGAEGGGLPAVLRQEGQCRTELIEAALRVEAGRFAFQNRVRENCGPGTPAEPVLHAAGGTVTLDGNNVVLHSDVGQAFSEARGIADETTITIRQLATDAGPLHVNWIFERGGPELVAPAGTEDRTDGAPSTADSPAPIRR
jgi:hypothetical protein